MTEFYTPSQRQLQDEFETRDLADRLAAAIVVEELSEQQAAFIQNRNMFFLSTIDEEGFPSASYKGGASGFVRVLNERLLVFPSYDGNGMFMSLGNVEACAKVGMLFVDFEKPQRLRVRGEARLLRDGPIFESYPGANVVVEVSVEKAWQNCPRYVHAMRLEAQSPAVPAEDGTVQFALWKRIDLMQDVLNERDRAQAKAIGLITSAEYQDHVSRGDLV